MSGGGWSGGGRGGSRGARGGGGRQPGGGRRFSMQAEDPPGTSRLFVAVPLPDEIRDAVGALMERVAGGPVDERRPGDLRWVRVDGLHLTLKFLGATPDPRQPEVAEALRAAAAGTGGFRISFQGAGAFPNPDYPRALWLGIADGAAELTELARRVDGELQRLGWPPEDRPFRAHLTLARSDGVPGAREAVARLIEEARALDASWRADRLVLYRSLLGRGPARYESLAETALADR